MKKVKEKQEKEKKEQQKKENWRPLEIRPIFVLQADGAIILSGNFCL